MRSDTAFDFFGHQQEGFLDIGGGFSTGLDVWHTQGISQVFGHLKVDGSAREEVTLVADYQLVDLVVSVALNLGQPMANVVEGVGFGDVVHHNDTMRTAVVRRHYGAKALLTRSVPLKGRKKLMLTG